MRRKEYLLSHTRTVTAICQSPVEMEVRGCVLTICSCCDFETFLLGPTHVSKIAVHVFSVQRSDYLETVEFLNKLAENLEKKRGGR